MLIHFLPTFFVDAHQSVYGVLTALHVGFYIIFFLFIVVLLISTIAKLSSSLYLLINWCI